MLGRLVSACALALALAATAAAQEEEPTAAPGSIAIGIIENANAEGVFDIVHNGQVSVRHIRSGLACHFARNGAGARIVLFRGLPRGDDVACDTTDGRESITLYATRYPQTSSLDEQMAVAEQALRTRFPNATPHAPTLAADGVAPPFRSVEYIVARPGDGARMYTRAAVAIISGWSIKLRYTLLAPDDATAAQGERTSLALWRAALADVMANPIP
jgi:hypothetical protein